MKMQANAKINLVLDVGERRPDGYHDVSMIMQEISLCDDIEITLRSDGKIHLVCSAPQLCDEKDNIAYKAALLFFKTTGKDYGCDITLTKRIPVCAGLGGGSSDAAAVIKGLNLLCNTTLTIEEMCTLGKALGADVPFFINGGTALAEGIGEILTPITGIRPKWLAVIKPDINISTPEAYRLLDANPGHHPDTALCAKCISLGNMAELYRNAGNSFEYFTSEKHPEINEIKKHLTSYGAEFAMMSGSGPSVFGIFDDDKKAAFALRNYKGSFSGGGICKFII